MSNPLVRTALSTGWTLFETDKGAGDEIAVKSVPTVAHLDLIAAGRIPDPFIGFNELQVEWVGQTAWTYRTKLRRPSAPPGSRIDLVFEGLDTFANVQINGKSVLRSSNMFQTYRCDVTELLETDDENELRVDFESALLKGREIMKEHPDHDFTPISLGSDTGRYCVRKAQYHWSWDWGPLLNTAGPWRPVWLEIYNSRIVDLWSEILPASDNKSASGTIHVRSEGPGKTVQVVMSIDGFNVFGGSANTAADGLTSFDVTIENPQLWYPFTCGSQPLYEISVKLLSDGHVLDSLVKKTGIRRVELVRDKDEIGESFYFRINGVDVFSGGSNWIPADNFLPRISKQKYREWLKLMVEGGQNMTRIWGGGIYEDDSFYEACDELGIMVWQDFMFACGNYPAYPEFLTSIGEEVRCNLRRLRHHPSIVIYAGNNEDYLLRDWLKLEYNKEDRDPESWRKSEFPGRYIYEYLLPKLVGDETPSVPYWPSSPYSDPYKSALDETVGDLHQWHVWHGSQLKYQEYGEIGGRFNSEFGLEGFPVMQTIREFVQDQADMHPRSHVVDFHNKAAGHERRIGLYLAENFRPTSTMESFVYLTQVSQSEAMYFAYKPWRRQYGENRKCGGALVWQLNDCWPATSWSLVDYHLRKKPAFYTIARCLAPVAVGVQREHHDWSVAHARPPKSSKWTLWVATSRLAPFEAIVELRFVSIKTGKDIKPAFTRTCQIEPNGTTLVKDGETQNTIEEPHVLSARILVDGVCVSRDADWPQPLKYLSFENPGLHISKAGKEIRVTAEKPVKALVVEEIDGVKFSDNCIDVIPGDEQVIRMEGSNVNQENLLWKHLGCEDGFRGVQRESKI